MLHTVYASIYEVRYCKVDSNILKLSSEMFDMFLSCASNLLNGTTVAGTLALPRWASVSSVMTDSTVQSCQTSDQSLLTTCVGSVTELSELISRTSSLPLNTRHMTWSNQAIQALFYFMRCSQVTQATFSYPKFEFEIFGEFYVYFIDS